MLISITGGSGFIGTRLTQRLRAKSHDVEILDIKKSNQFGEDCKYVDIRDETAIRHHMAGQAIVHLAAVHRDDVRPLSLYSETNVDGTKNVCKAAEDRGIERIIFTSSVAVYGFASPDTGEDGEVRPFNEYGRTKYEAELVLREWQQRDPESRSLTIIRPTVVFGEGNRGNVFNLLRQIDSGIFAMIGNGRNRKSMAYVENVAAFIEHCLCMPPGVHLFNYIDKPDFTMNEFVKFVRGCLKNEWNVGMRIPLFLGYTMGYLADAIARISGRPLPISSIRVKKFASNTCFASGAHGLDGFIAPVELREALERTLGHEFIQPNAAAEEFFTE